MYRLNAHSGSVTATAHVIEDQRVIRVEVCEGSDVAAIDLTPQQFQSLSSHDFSIDRIG